MDDKQILDLYWERSEAAISETSKKYGKYCRYIAFNILHNDEDSEECVNDTYLRAWNSIPPNRPSVLKTFLGKITRNLSLDRYELLNAKKRNGGQIPCVIFLKGLERQFCPIFAPKNDRNKALSIFPVVFLFPDGKEDFMPRMSKKRKQDWALFLNERNRITYNELCRKCSNDCKQSFRCIVVLCPKYLSKRRTKKNEANGK